MTQLLEKLARMAGKDPERLERGSAIGKIFRRNGVRKSAEFDRIRWLPKRDAEGAEELAQALTSVYKTPKGTMELRPIQALALEQIHDFGGLLGPMRVGAGKTLVTFLAGAVTEAKRPLLLIPAKLREKTLRDMRELRKHWKFATPRLLHYEQLSRVNSARALEVLKPDLIIADEAHKLKNKKAAVTKRVARYMQANPDTGFVALSGTITMRSLRDYAHLSEWALGALSPLPREWSTLEEWSDALDVKVPDTRRMAPGVLTELMSPEERSSGDELTAVRSAFRRRLTESTGVVATGDQQVACSLSIQAVEPEYGEATEQAFAHMRSTWETPDGHPIADAQSYWRHARELTCGFYYVWDPRPPQSWLDARKKWCSECRQVLTYNRKELDSELQVVQAIDRGDVKGFAAEALTEWRAVRQEFVPNVEPRWIDSSVVDYVERWLSANNGIVWVEHVALGFEIERQLRRPYYGQRGRTKTGAFIEDARGGIVASVLANAEGRNLQSWSRNLVTSWPPNGGIVEQCMGRTHRDGQEADEVSFDVFCSCIQSWVGLLNAKQDAQYIEKSTGQNQKLNFADLTWPTASEIAMRPEARWKSAS